MKRKYITPDIIKVIALDNYLLHITFKNKEEKIYDMKKLINSKNSYKNLKDKDYFKNVKPRGDTVEWEKGEDVFPEELYYESKKIEKYTF